MFKNDRLASHLDARKKHPDRMFFCHFLVIPEFYAAELSKLAGKSAFCRLTTARCIIGPSGWLHGFVGDKIDIFQKICQFEVSYTLVYVGIGTPVTQGLTVSAYYNNRFYDRQMHHRRLRLASFVRQRKNWYISRISPNRGVLHVVVCRN